jgi:hypothetical protein
MFYFIDISKAILKPVNNYAILSLTFTMGS